MNNKIFDIYQMTNYKDDPVLIISSKTGIYYSSQCGGVACLHPEYEGFIKMLSIDDFDDCRYGCSSIHNLSELQYKLAFDIDKFIKDQTEKWMFKLSFDFNRIEDLKEGWWPVLLNGKLDLFDDFLFTNNEAILCTGNCD